MATKKTTKKAATAKSSSKKTTAAAATSKTTVTRVTSKAETKKPEVKSTAVKPVRTSSPRKKLDTKLPRNLVNIVLAEVAGTFILTLVALFSAYMMTPFYIGLALVVLVLGIGAISGAHINPAVTFGLWTMRKLQAILVPFYWAAQFLGAMAAVVLMGAISSGSFVINFDQFTTFSWAIFAVELVGMAVFMFGVSAALSRTDLKNTSRAVVIGMSLTLGLVVSGALLPLAQNAAVQKYQQEQANASRQTQQSKDQRTYPREVYISGATLNPAVALAVTEKTNSQLQNASAPAQTTEKMYTRLSLEVIAATLVGAALGGNLFLLIGYRNKVEE